MEPVTENILQEYGNCSKEVKDAIFGAYKTMVDGISEAPFKTINDEIKNTGKQIKIDQVADTMKKKFYEMLESKFSSCWTKSSLGDAIALLELSKDLTKDDTKKERPSGAEVIYQSRPVVVKKLLKRKEALINYREEQNEQLNDLVIQVQDSRNNLRAWFHKRQQIVDRIKNDQELINVETEINNIYSTVMMDQRKIIEPEQLNGF